MGLTKIDIVASGLFNSEENGQPAALLEVIDVQISECDLVSKLMTNSVSRRPCR